jgi:hypothetical protein
MARQFNALLLFGVAALAAGCSHSPSRFAKKIAGICPKGWRVSASNDVILVRRKSPVWIMGKVGPPASILGESDESYFKREGEKTDCELRLRFVPLMSKPEFEKLKAARAQAAARLGKGAPGKTEYTQLQIQYAQCQVPAFFTKDYSIYVDRMDTHVLEIYPPEAAAETETLVSSLKKLFNQYEGVEP